MVVRRETLKKYTGQYRYDENPDSILTISMNSGNLIGTPPGTAGTELYAESEIHFKVDVMEIMVKFNLNTSGEVQGLTISKGDIVTTLKKIN